MIILKTSYTVSESVHNINLTDAIYVQVGVGIPLGKKYYNEENARMYFAINTDIDKILLKPRERL